MPLSVMLPLILYLFSIKCQDLLIENNMMFLSKMFLFYGNDVFLSKTALCTKGIERFSIAAS